MIKVGLTGGIGAGKTLVSQIFHLLGVPVYYADQRAKWLMANNSSLIVQIKSIFGDEAYSGSNQLNREYLASRVFNNADQLEKLNKLVHPTVGEDYQEWLRQHAESAYTIKEAALIFETQSHQTLDKVILVTAPVKVRVERTLFRDNHRSRSQVNDIIERQMQENEKKSLADIIIDNDGTKLLIPQVMKINQMLMEESLK